MKGADVLRTLYDAVWLASGAGIYWGTRNTPPLAHQALIRLFCRTGGRSNDLLAQWIRWKNRSPRLPSPRGEFGVPDSNAVQRITQRLREDGYFVFEERLSEAACDRLLQFAWEHPARIRPTTGQPIAHGANLRARYDQHNPATVRYDFDAQDVLALPDVQQLLANPALLSVACEYLGTVPVADVVGMWWHTAYLRQPDEDAAQFFHFDMDRIQWLKFFVYLTDVGPESGPHCFIRGSHRTYGIPRELLAKGYARITDEDVFRHYDRSRAVEILGPRGTIIVEDTRGLHKGREVLSGDRLMLQIQFSNSLFGSLYPRVRSHAVSPQLEAMAKSFPEIYRNYFGEDS